MSDDPFMDNVSQRLSEGETIDDVTIISSEDGVRMALILKEGRADVLGCEICILPSMIDHLPDGMMVISGRDSLPMSAIVEDDSRNPAMLAMRLCPACLRPILHDDYIKIVGFDVEEG